MFTCETTEGEELAVKPMNCPGHCLMFNHAKSGHYAQDEYARTLGRLLANFPGLLDWIAQADRAAANTPNPGSLS